MSLITHCPACGTTFKVVRDQLRISDGWVRCGQCAEVFDSTPSLREVELNELAEPSLSAPLPDAGTWAPAPSVPDIPLDALTAPEPQASPYADIVGSAVLPSVQSPLPEPVQAVDWPLPEAPLPDIALALDPDEVTGFSPSQNLAASVDRMSSLLGDDAHQSALLASASAATGASVSAGINAPAVATEAAPPEPLSQFSFQDKVGRNSSGTAPSLLSRVALVVVGVLLTVLLLGQVIVQERDRIAALQPQWRPALQGLCGVLSCQVRPWRQIEAISVDASAFNKLRGDTYRLSFVLKNAADMALAYPAVELTLTDSQDIPLLRRVLQPAELNPKSSVLAAGSEWSGSTLVALSGEAGGGALARRVAGYRILAFYP